MESPVDGGGFCGFLRTFETSPDGSVILRLSAFTPALRHAVIQAQQNQLVLLLEVRVRDDHGEQWLLPRRVAQVPCADQQLHLAEEHHRREALDEERRQCMAGPPLSSEELSK